MNDYFLVDNKVFRNLRELIGRINFIHFPKFFRYYTIWGLISHTFLPDSHFFLLVKLQMALQIAIGGFYITYISPRYLILPFWKIMMCEYPLFFCDAISHYLPFLYYLFCYNIQYKSLSDFFVGFAPFLFYFSLHNSFELYHINKVDFFFIAFCYLFLSTFMGIFYFSTE